MLMQQNIIGLFRHHKHYFFKYKEFITVLKNVKYINNITEELLKNNDVFKFD